MSRRYPAQIVAMCKEPMRDWVVAQASEHDQPIAAELRHIVTSQQRLTRVAKRSGLTVEDLLAHLERQASDAA